MEKAIVLGKPVDTIAITQSLGLQTFRRSRHLWSKEDDELLLNRLNQLYPELLATQDFDANKVDWRLVAEAFGDSRKAKECRRRWVALLNPNLRRGRWTADEDQLLMEQYNLHGPLWQTIARNIQGRSEHQCSKRYREILDPGVRDRLKPWTDEEDLLLVRMISKHGTKWKTIAQGLELRLSLTCRNRWRTLTTDIARGRAKALLLDTISQVVEGESKNRLRELLSSLHLGSNATGAESSLSSSSDLLRASKGNADSAETSFRPLIGGEFASGNDYLPFPVKSEYAGELSESHENQQVSKHPDRNSANADFPTSLSMSLDSPVSNTGSGKSTLSSAVPVKTEDEWTFNLLQKGNGESSLPNELSSASGSINSEQLVHHLVQYASLRGVDINVYHHVHHHYQNNQQGLLYGDQRTKTGAVTGESPGFSGNSGFTPPPPSFSFAEYEAQRKRHQHFNYLPPLMSVPQLTSSVVATPTTHHHHHHHHHHHSKDENSGKRAHNENHEHENTYTNGSKVLEDPIDDFGRIPELDRTAKRAKTSDEQIEDNDEELEFFESLRNLRGTSTETDTEQKAVIDHAPVSQHHPLHYTGGNSGLPDSFFDADAEDLIDSYGQFYHLYLNDPVYERKTEDSLPFGAIPFNPS